MMLLATEFHALNEFLATTITEDGYTQNGHDFGMTFIEALAIGITTIEEAKFHSFLSMCYYEGYKDVHGIKARWVHYGSTTIAQLESMLDGLHCEGERQHQYESEQAIREQEAFEDEIASIIECGAGDRETALRWIAQGQEFWTGQCLEHFVWGKGLLFTDYGRAIIAEMRPICEKYKLFRYFHEIEEAA